MAQNATLNSGRMLVDLKPHGDRRDSASEVIARLRESARSVEGISLYLPGRVPELTIEDRVSRTQFQFALTCRGGAISRVDAALVGALQALQLADVASDLQDRGLQAYVEIDRDASRLGVAVADIDDTLYSAFGRRQGSHALHAHEPVPRRPRGGAAARSRSRDRCSGLYVRTRAGKPVPLSSIAPVSTTPNFVVRLITSGRSPRLPFRLIWAAKHPLARPCRPSA
jgi:multidrug efflux pump